MNLVTTLGAACAFVAVFRVPLKRWAWAFYVVALLLDVLLLVGQNVGLPAALWRMILTLHVRGLFAFALFAIVMFIGVLKPGSRLRLALAPIRGELSIVAAILIVGHICSYISTYLVRLSSGMGRWQTLVGVCVALVLMCLLAALAITSFQRVKRRMSAGRWKALQRYAYVFWGLVFIHVCLMLGASALGGAEAARESLVSYTVLFGLYAALRVRRGVLDAGDRSVTGALDSSGQDAMGLDPQS